MVTKSQCYRWLGPAMCVWETTLCPLHLSILFFSDLFFLFSVYMFECMYVYHIPAGTLGSQKGTLDSLDLELQVVVSCYAGTRDGTWVLCKSGKGLLSCSRPLWAMFQSIFTVKSLCSPGWP